MKRKTPAIAGVHCLPGCLRSFLARGHLCARPSRLAQADCNRLPATLHLATAARLQLAITLLIFFCAFGPYFRRLLLELLLDFFADDDCDVPLDLRAVAMVI
jgi:hypothetical protein